MVGTMTASQPAATAFRLQQLKPSGSVTVWRRKLEAGGGRQLPHLQDRSRARDLVVAQGGSAISRQGQKSHPSDLYKEQAADYVKWRPTYPPLFLRGLADLAPARDMLWDVGTGSGQAAVGLAPYFNRVVATDVSPWQLAQAPPVHNVTYLTTSANMGIDELREVVGGLETVDMVTIASALHFFDVHKLTELVLHALKPGGIYAPFTYNMPTFSTSRLDAAMEAILFAMAGPKYREEAAARECNPLDGYKNMYFPFEPANGRVDTAPELGEMRFVWRFENLMGFMASTSYIKRLAELQTGGQLLGELEQAWAEGGEEQEVVFKLWSRVGRKNA